MFSSYFTQFVVKKFIHLLVSVNILLTVSKAAICTTRSYTEGLYEHRHTHTHVCKIYIPERTS